MLERLNLNQFWFLKYTGEFLELKYKWEVTPDNFIVMDMRDIYGMHLYFLANATLDELVRFLITYDTRDKRRDWVHRLLREQYNADQQNKADRMRSVEEQRQREVLAIFGNDDSDEEEEDLDTDAAQINSSTTSSTSSSTATAADAVQTNSSTTSSTSSSTATAADAVQTNSSTTSSTSSSTATAADAVQTNSSTTSSTSFSTLTSTSGSISSADASEETWLMQKRYYAQYEGLLRVPKLLRNISEFDEALLWSATCESLLEEYEPECDGLDDVEVDEWNIVERILARSPSARVAATVAGREDIEKAMRGEYLVPLNQEEYNDVQTEDINQEDCNSCNRTNAQRWGYSMLTTLLPSTAPAANTTRPHRNPQQTNNSDNEETNDNESIDSAHSQDKDGSDFEGEDSETSSSASESDEDNVGSQELEDAERNNAAQQKRKQKSKSRPKVTTTRVTATKASAAPTSKTPVLSSDSSAMSLTADVAQGIVLHNTSASTNAAVSTEDVSPAISATQSSSTTNVTMNEFTALAMREDQANAGNTSAQGSQQHLKSCISTRSSKPTAVVTPTNSSKRKRVTAATDTLNSNTAVVTTAVATTSSNKKRVRFEVSDINEVSTRHSTRSRGPVLGECIYISLTLTFHHGRLEYLYSFCFCAQNTRKC